ncbi:MAG: ATP:cob(I)alamin adenosyltransferase [Bacillus subtilis]|nr:ATP:cob(I)alamin adenosyltransferase [Bacillus subtilis]
MKPLGAIDECSSAIGLAYHHAKIDDFLTIQQLLQTINSLLAGQSRDRWRTLRQTRQNRRLGNRMD